LAWPPPISTTSWRIPPAPVIMGVVIERITALLLAAGLALSAGGGRDSVNFSQEPGFAEYFAAHPLATTPAEPADQELLRRHRPRFMRPPSHPGAIDFYTDRRLPGEAVQGAGTAPAHPDAGARELSRALRPSSGSRAP
jgi:hypothetical protein